MDTTDGSARPAYAAQFVPVADPKGGPTPEEWQRISRELRRPLDPAAVDIMLDFHSTPHRGEGGKMVQGCVVYASRAAVMDRLDDVVGPGAWASDFEAVVLDREIRLTKSWITIYGQAPKSDVGVESKQANSMGAVSHGVRRAGDCWGVARYLRHLPELEIEVYEAYKDKNQKPVYKVVKAAEDALRERLRAWDGRPGTFPTAAARPAARTAAPAATAPAGLPAPSVTGSSTERRQQLRDETAAARAASPQGFEPPADITFTVDEDGDAPVSKVGQPGFISDQQLVSIKKLWAAARAGQALPADIERWAGDRAGKEIGRLSAEYQAARRQPTPAGAR